MLRGAGVKSQLLSPGLPEESITEKSLLKYVVHLTRVRYESNIVLQLSIYQFSD